MATAFPEWIGGIFSPQNFEDEPVNHFHSVYFLLSLTVICVRERRTIKEVAFF